jgi:hypothetical protein
MQAEAKLTNVAQMYTQIKHKMLIKLKSLKLRKILKPSNVRQVVSQQLARLQGLGSLQLPITPRVGNDLRLILPLAVPFPVIKRLLQTLLLSMNLVIGDMRHLIKVALQVEQKCWVKVAPIRIPMVLL